MIPSYQHYANFARRAAGSGYPNVSLYKPMARPRGRTPFPMRRLPPWMQVNNRPQMMPQQYQQQQIMQQPQYMPDMWRILHQNRQPSLLGQQPQPLQPMNPLSSPWYGAY